MVRCSKNKNILESSNATAVADEDDVSISQETQNLPQLKDEHETNAKCMLEMEETIQNLTRQNLEIEHQFQFKVQELEETNTQPQTRLIKLEDNFR